jgi:hypothetical protein
MQVKGNLLYFFECLLKFIVVPRSRCTREVLERVEVP